MIDRSLTLYEPVSIMYIFITVLIMAFSGELFWVADATHERSCHQRNAQLLEDHREGPLQACTGVF